MAPVDGIPERIVELRLIADQVADLFLHLDLRLRDLEGQVLGATPGRPDPEADLYPQRRPASQVVAVQRIIPNGGFKRG